IIGYTFSKNFYNDRDLLVHSRVVNYTGEEELFYKQYNFNGLATKNKHIHRANLGATHSVSTQREFEYDHAGRLLREYHQINGAPKQIVVENEYNERDLLKRKNLGVASNGNALQSLDYHYNIRKWLTGINTIKSRCKSWEPISPDDQVGLYNNGGRLTASLNSNIKDPSPNRYENDLFALQLNYQNATNAQYNGNIGEISWQTGCGTEIKQYDFTYDNRDQLTSAHFNQGQLLNNMTNTGAFDVNISYDLNGNIQSLSRKGDLNTIDDLHYSYNKVNQLVNLEELADLTDGFKSSRNSAGYQYDAKGNMIRDEHKKVSITYNVFNLPEIFAFDSQDSIKLQYNAIGEKIGKFMKPHNSNTWNSKHYFGEIEYSDDALEAIYFSEGRVLNNNGNWQYEYAIKDHLGNTRVTFSDLDANGTIERENGEVLQENHYYPFGMQMSGPWQQVIGAENAYQYNGKEMMNDFGLNWLDYDARWYDPAIARWHSIDPLAEKMQSWSPYNYVFNNPIKLIDPDGMEPDEANEEEEEEEESCNCNDDVFFIIDVGPFIFTRGTDGVIRVRRRTRQEMVFFEGAYVLAIEGLNKIPLVGSAVDAIVEGYIGGLADDANITMTSEGIKHWHKELENLVDGTNAVISVVTVGSDLIDIFNRPATRQEALTDMTFQYMTAYFKGLGLKSRETFTGSFYIRKSEGWSAGQVFNAFISTYQILNEHSSLLDMGTIEDQSFFIDDIFPADGSLKRQVHTAIEERMDRNFGNNPALFDKR
ncbi:MAG: RHS repeat-associated core domain-containing protein, partial [Flavobacteriales bacterium]|nr:RHS repeat-associated core domain-containing protein [Flavobacteriales bacterium]